jgi:hypothetical protein
LEEQLQDLRGRARELAREFGAKLPQFLDVLHEINRVRVLLQWPARAAQRGKVEPYRFR